MATWYVNSAAAGTAAGTSWANACLTLAAAITLSAAGDDFNVLSTHAETQASAMTLTFKGTPASPNRVFSCGNTNSPATASDLTTGASITTTASSPVAINGCVYIYGVTFNAGSGAISSNLTLAGGSIISETIFDSCALNLLGTGNPAQFNIGGGGTAGVARVVLLNTTATFNGSSGSLINVNACQFFWKNTAPAVAGSAAIANLITASVRAAFIILDGLDLTHITTGNSLVGPVSNSSVIQIVNCKLAAGVLFATPTQSGAFVDIINCDSGATGYRQERHPYQGTLTTETTVVRSGGASDGVQAISHKVVTTANSKRQSPFESFEIAQWVDTTGSHTATIEVITDNVVLTNADLWVEAQYLGSASQPLASTISSAPATQLTAGSNLTTSAASWTTTGLGTPKPQSVAVTFTANMRGYVRLMVKVAKATTTVWVDPSVTIT